MFEVKVFVCANAMKGELSPREQTVNTTGYRRLISAIQARVVCDDRGLGGHGTLGARLQFAGGVRGGNRDAGADAVWPTTLDGDWLVAAAVGGQRIYNLVLPAIHAG